MRTKNKFNVVYIYKSLANRIIKEAHKHNMTIAGYISKKIEMYTRQHK